MAKKSVCRTHDCSLCCTLGTDVPLTNKDIERIKELGYKEEFFVEEVKGWKLLKLEDNTCVFLLGGICSIHKNRPESCRLYPAVFEVNTNEVIVDPECVYSDEFRITKKDIESLHALSDLLDKERAERLAAKGLSVEQVDKIVDENGLIDEIEEEDEPETVDDSNEEKQEDKKNEEKEEKKEKIQPAAH